TARGMMQAERSHLPIKINISGVVPPIFPSSRLRMPPTAIQMMGSRGSAGSNDTLITISTYLQHGSPLYLLLYGAGISFFCFFYPPGQINLGETSEPLKRYGGFMPA